MTVLDRTRKTITLVRNGHWPVKSSDSLVPPCLQPVTRHDTRFRPPYRAAFWADRVDLLRAVVNEAQRIVMVVAPAGYGKTVLLTQYYEWLAARKEGVGWITLDRRDDSPDVLLSSVVAVLQGDGSPGKETMALDPVSDGSVTAQTDLDGTLARISVSGKRFHLFLDDLDQCASPAAIGLLVALIARAPDNLRFIFAARAQPRIPLGRFKAQGSAITLDSWDLRFNEQDAKALLRGPCGNVFASDQVSRAVEATEGWAMALRLAGVALCRHGRDVDIAAYLSRPHYSLDEYLAENVLAFQSSQTIDFLARTCVFERFSAEMCDQVLGLSSAASIIEALDRANMFLVAVDEGKTWFRYHAVFRGFLERRFLSTHEKAAAGLCRSACHWLCQNGHHLDALAMATRTNDTAFIAGVLDSLCDRLFQGGHIDLLCQAAIKLPLEVVAKYPRLALWAVWADNTLGNLYQAQHLLSMVEAVLGQAPPAPGEQDPSCTRLEDDAVHRRMMIAMTRGEMAQVEALCNLLLARTSFSDAYLAASVHAARIYARQHLFDCRGVTGRADQIIAHLPERGVCNGSIWINCIVGLVHERRGEIELAKRAYSDALQRARSIRKPFSPIAMPATLLAQVHYERDDVEAARALLELNTNDQPSAGLLDQFSSGQIIRSRLASLSGDRAKAARILDEAIDLFLGRGLDCARKAVVAERVRLATIDGKTEDAAAIAAANGIALRTSPPLPQAGATTWDWLDALTWCRIAVNAGQYRLASATLRSWIDYCRIQHSERPAVQMTIQLAQIKMLEGDQGSALKLARSALAAGQQMGLVRSFVDEGGYFHALLRMANDESSSLSEGLRDYLGMLLEKFPDDREGRASQDLLDAAGLMVTPLNKRELEILSFVSKGIKGRFVAAQLELTEGTVKWYIQQIFDKLNVRTRSEAVARARLLGLIP